MAAATARALVDADAQGLASHGVSRIPQYATHLAQRPRRRAAQPQRARSAKGGAVLVDARCGLAFPACALAVDEAIARAREFGVAFAGVTNSHHFGVAAYHLEPVGAARHGRPGVRQFAGGDARGRRPASALRHQPDRRGVSAPRRRRRSSIDLSLSEVARGKVMVAAKEGRPIPLGWALDGDGRPTTDPKAGLAGSMLPMGGTKGAMLALVVELLVTALTGAAMGFEASSFFVDEGNRPRIGQAFLVVDPDALAGRDVYLARIETLIAEMTEGPRRAACPARAATRSPRGAQASGIEIPQALAAKLALARRADPEAPMTREGLPRLTGAAAQRRARDRPHVPADLRDGGRARSPPISASRAGKT